MSTIQESETKVKGLEKQLEDGRKKIIELETKLASRPQVDTELFGLRIIESYAHKSMDLEKRLRASTEQAAKLSAENRQLADSNWRTNRLFEQLLPLGGGGTAIWSYRRAWTCSRQYSSTCSWQYSSTYRWRGSFGSGCPSRIGSSGSIGPSSTCSWCCHCPTELAGHCGR